MYILAVDQSVLLLKTGNDITSDNVGEYAVSCSRQTDRQTKTGRQDRDKQADKKDRQTREARQTYGHLTLKQR